MDGKFQKVHVYHLQIVVVAGCSRGQRHSLRYKLGDEKSDPLIYEFSFP